MRSIVVIFCSLIFIAAPVQAANCATNSDTPTFFSLLLSWFPMLLLIGVWIYFMKQLAKRSGKPGNEGIPEVYKKLSEMVDVHKEILETLKKK